jgi:phosphate transport system permease protein
MLSLVFLLLWVVLVNGLGVFWPARIAEVVMTDGSKFLGEEIRSAVNPDTGVLSVQYKTGNREQDPQRQDFRWAAVEKIQEKSYPKDVYVLERMENGNFHGFLKAIQGPDLTTLDTKDLQKALLSGKQIVDGKAGEESSPISAEVLVSLRQNVAVFSNAAGLEQAIPLIDIVRIYQPNAMGVFAKCGYYLTRIRELLFDNPRESNTEGGLFPAIFGTVMMIFLMAATCFPLGVLAGIYLGEYAKEGLLVRVVRIAVNNLAGIPSIVYGIFGLGFFVYGIGGQIDQWFFAERAATGTPTFGTGGILWASLTLGLLTVPVVIVSTEEALRAIPRSMREGSLALGATKLQTLLRVLIPMASPGMMTGFILAMARAAGEVAPLMITGVVKMAPDLPLDHSFPFLHLDRKFMHLGFHIYDVGFQSPNVEASKPMVYVTTLLLLLIVLVMTSTAIYLRNRMRKRFQIRTI